MRGVREFLNMEGQWLWTTFLATVVILCAYYLRGFVRFVYLTARVQGPSLWELATVYGRRLLNHVDIADCLVELSARYDFQPWGLYWKGGHFGLFTSDIESAKEIITNNYFTDKSDFAYPMVGKYFGKGLIVLNGPEYRRHRKLLSPALKKRVLEDHLPRINQEVTTLLERIREHTDGEETDRRTLVHDKVCATATTVISSGKIPYSRLKDVSAFTQIGVELIMLETMNPVWQLLKLRKSLRNKITTFWNIMGDVKQIMWKEKMCASARLQEEDRQPTDILECLSFESGERGFSKDEYFAEFHHFFAASVETSQFAELTCLFLLALHPEVQERAYEEQQLIFGGSDRAAEPEDLYKMVYLEIVLKETMRLFPPVPIFGRKVEKETTFKFTV